MGTPDQETVASPTAGLTSASEILPLVYDELRRLAAARLAHEKPGQTLQATALVHEVWLRLGNAEGQWDSKAHFFAAAAEAMRRILLDNARRKLAHKRSGGLHRTELDMAGLASPLPDEQLLALDEALDAFSREDPVSAELVKLRFFIGLSHQDAAEILGLNRSSADRAWVYARAWLADRLKLWPEI